MGAARCIVRGLGHHLSPLVLRTAELPSTLGLDACDAVGIDPVAGLVHALKDRGRTAEALS